MVGQVGIWYRCDRAVLTEDTAGSGADLCNLPRPAPVDDAVAQTERAVGQQHDTTEQVFDDGARGEGNADPADAKAVMIPAAGMPTLLAP